MKYSENVDKLLNYGIFNFDRDWSGYLKLGFTEQDIPALLRLAQDDELALSEDETISSAPYHAWRVLGLLKSEDAIEPLLDNLDESLDNEEDDWGTEEVGSILGLIGEKAIAPIKQCLNNPVSSEDKKSVLIEAYKNVINNDPEYREQGVNFLTDYLAGITVKNSRLAGYVISSLIDINAKESIEAIRTAIEGGYVDISIAGDIEDVEIEMGFRTERTTQKPNYHQHFLDALAGRERAAATTKIGRNDPCPCGSGKKYKKCCLQ